MTIGQTTNMLDGRKMLHVCVCVMGKGITLVQLRMDSFDDNKLWKKLTGRSVKVGFTPPVGMAASSPSHQTLSLSSSQPVIIFQAQKDHHISSVSKNQTLDKSPCQAIQMWNQCNNSLGQAPNNFKVFVICAKHLAQRYPFSKNCVVPS